jgi:hypothetical protein
MWLLMTMTKWHLLIIAVVAYLLLSRRKGDGSVDLSSLRSSSWWRAPSPTSTPYSPPPAPPPLMRAPLITWDAGRRNLLTV